MKKLIIGIVAVLGLTGCNNAGEYLDKQNNVDVPKSEIEKNSSVSQGEENTQGSLDIIPTDVFNTINELAESSPVVVVGQIKNNGKPFEYSSATFFEFQVQVKSIYRDTEGVLTKNGTITLLQNDIDEVDPLVKKGEKVLLFLTKYEGPVIENAYRIVGLYQGHFKIDNSGNLITVGNKNPHKIEKTTIPKLSSLDKVLENNPYVPEELTPMTDEEIEAGNENEKRLLEELNKNDKNNN